MKEISPKLHLGNCIFIILPSIYYIIQYLISGQHFSSGFHFGPSWDNIQALERYFDITYLQNDFFTNSSSEPSPRKFFIYLVSIITKIFFNDYFYSIYFLKILITALFPLFVMLFFTDRFKEILKNKEQLLIFTAIFSLFLIFANSNFIISQFSIASWRPLPLWPTSQGLALTLAFASAYFINNKKYLGYFLFFCVALIHFTNAALIAVLISIFAKNKKDFIQTNIILLAILLFSFAVLSILFSSTNNLSDQEFIEYYVMQPYIHTHHYRPEWLAPYGIFRWPEVLMIYNYFFFISAAIMLIIKKYRLCFICLSFGIAYYLFIKAQVIFINEYPNKLIAAFGPTRFAQFGYFMITSITSFYLAAIINKISNKTLVKQKLINFIEIKKEKFVLFAILFSFVGSLTYSYIIENPRNQMVSNKELDEWVVQNTKESDVFAIPYPRIDYWIQFSSYTKRPTYYANAMAFNYKSLKQSNERKNLLYGKWQEWGEGGPPSFYCRLTAPRITKAAKIYQLDYIIINNECVNSSLKILKKTYKDKEITVFKLPKI